MRTDCPFPSWASMGLRSRRPTGKTSSVCLRYYNAEHSASIHDSSLHCTFCGKLFPIFYLLPINPEGLDDWRNIHYRCCYQCATCANDDYVWYSECSNLSTARLGARGNLGNRHYDHTDRNGLFDRDDDVARLAHCHRGYPRLLREGLLR